MKRNVDVMRAFAAIVSAALFSVIFAVLASSCTDNSSSQPTPEKKKNATLKLTLTGTPVANGRATGAAFPTKEDKINTLAVGIFDAVSGDVNVVVECTVDDKGVTDPILCSAGLCNVIVVANAPEKTFDGVQNKAEFLQKTVLLSQTAIDGVQTSDNLPMSGQVSEPVDLRANVENTFTVTLKRLVARISIECIKTKFTAANSNSKATFTLKKVFIYNALFESHIAPEEDGMSNMPVTPQWVDGGCLDAGNKWVDGESYLLNEIKAVPLSGEGVNAYTIPTWFYAFANNDGTHPTKVVIGGEYDPDGPDGPTTPAYVYYPIVVNQAQEGTNFQGSGAGEAHDGTIARNVDYRLSATIAKKGVETPDEEMKVAEMQLTVTVAGWELNILQDVVIE